MGSRLNRDRLPQFIIAGAPRAGTTWLYEVADRHPAIAMARPIAPEPKFFLIDALYERGLAAYSERWFAALPPGLLYGEKTTNYLESSAARARIASALPEVKLVFMLRDPVERAHSNYLWSARNGLEHESFARGLELEPERELSVPSELRYARPHAYISRGLYADLLAPWFASFPAENILVMLTEEIASAPGEVARSLHRFLGVAERPDLAEHLGKINAARPEGSPEIEPSLRRALVERFREPNARLSRLLGRPLTAWDAGAAAPTR